MCGAENGAAWPIIACTGRLGCAPHGRHTFLACPRKVCQRRAPGIRVSLRETPLAPVPLRGPAYKGHPWPIKPLAASMRLVPLRNTYARPADGTGSRACEISAESSSAASVFAFVLKAAIAQTTPKPPSGGRVESPRKGLSDMDVARATMGQGWPFVACPWSGDGKREPRRSRGRMVGCPSLWLLSLGQARESDSPVGAKPIRPDGTVMDRAKSSATHTYLPVRCQPALSPNYAKNHFFAAS